MSRRSRRNGETLLWRFISLSPARRAVFLLSVALVLTTSASFAAESRPNIILLVTDDQRWDAISCAGNPHIRTPKIGRAHV